MLEDDVVACPFRRPATGTDILVLKRLRAKTKKKKIFVLERRWCALWGVDGCFLAKKRYKKKGGGIRKEKKTGVLVLVNLDLNQYLVMSIVFTTTRKEKKKRG